MLSINALLLCSHCSLALEMLKMFELQTNMLFLNEHVLKKPACCFWKQSIWMNVLIGERVWKSWMNILFLKTTSSPNLCFCRNKNPLHCILFPTTALYSIVFSFVFLYCMVFECVSSYPNSGLEGGWGGVFVDFFGAFSIYTLHKCMHFDDARGPKTKKTKKP